MFKEYSDIIKEEFLADHLMGDLSFFEGNFWLDVYNESNNFNIAVTREPTTKLIVYSNGQLFFKKNIKDVKNFRESIVELKKFMQERGF